MTHPVHAAAPAETLVESYRGLADAVLMLDIDDFKRVNGIHGHAVGDDVLMELVRTLLSNIRAYDISCRLGGEEFAVIMPGSRARDAERLARRVIERVNASEFGAAGRLTISVGIAEGPADASNPREVTACAEAAMMTAKARGKNQVVRFAGDSHERPESFETDARDVRSIAHLKLLQSLGAKLGRFNDTREIGVAITNELRALIDYHNCRGALVEGDMIVPIAFQGDLLAPPSTTIDVLTVPVGYGITGHVVATGKPLLTGNAATCERGS